ncbi:MAG: response regulator [Caldilineaceae bacterium]|nr:response regulator [Caldilineaceae bacterium]
MAKVLVVEDEAVLREALADWLVLEGHAALCAHDGQAGVESATLHLPDLILCDIMMPRLNGYEVFRTLHADQLTAGIPFVFMSARVTPEDIRLGLDLGADGYITKPFTRLELLTAIQKFLF